MLMVRLGLFLSFLHFLPHLLIMHHSWCYHARSQGINRRHARGRWWIWRGIGACWLVSWIRWWRPRIRRPDWGVSWIPLGSSWGSGERARWRRKGRIARRWMGRIGTSRVPDIRGIWIWPWLPRTGIPHGQVFPTTCFIPSSQGSSTVRSLGAQGKVSNSATEGRGPRTSQSPSLLSLSVSVTSTTHRFRKGFKQLHLPPIPRGTGDSTPSPG